MPRLLLAVLALAAAACAPGPRPRGLVIGYPAGPATAIPDTVNEEITISVLSNVYESLVDFDAKLAVRPGLAASWYTADDRTWVFRLREGVRLHDGRPLNSGHVVAALERARLDPGSTRRAELAVVESVEGRDPHTVAVRTRFPFGALPHRLGNVAIWTPAPRAGEPPVGTGPYTFESFTPSGDVVLRAFDAYHQGAPSIRTVRFRVVPALQTRLAQLRKGELDLVVDVPPEAARTLGTGVRTISERGLRVLFLAMDCRAGSPFQDARVRRAVSLAVDRDALVQGPLEGHGEPAHQVVVPGVFGYHERLDPVLRDAAAARRLLAEAGWPGGFEVDLDYMPQKYRAMEEVVAQLAGDLQGIGIRVRPRTFDAAAFFPRSERAGALSLLGWMSTGGDALVSYNYLLRTPGGGFGIENGSRYSSAVVDGLLEQAMRQLDPEKRAHLLARVAEEVQRDAPVAPLYRQGDLYGVAAGLEFQPRVDRRLRAAHMRWRRPA